MRVFISWSEKGSRSHRLAEALAEWLPNVIQVLDPWISSHSIEKGERGLMVLKGALETIPFGIACLTPESLRSEWIHFESGALSKTSEKLWTFLLDLKFTDVTGPLSAFQHTTTDRDDVWQLLLSMREEVAKVHGSALTERQLEAAFAKQWPDFAANVEKLRKLPAAKKVPARSVEEMMVELLTLQREQARTVDETIRMRMEHVEHLLRRAIPVAQRARARLATESGALRTHPTGRMAFASLVGDSKEIQERLRQIVGGTGWERLILPRGQEGSSSSGLQEHQRRR